MTIEQAIKKSIEGGYPPPVQYGEEYINFLRLRHTLLDPAFWKSLGKSLGWADMKAYQNDSIHSFITTELPEAQWYSRCFMNHIWDGGTPESFFETL